MEAPLAIYNKNAVDALPDEKGLLVATPVAIMHFSGIKGQPALLGTVIGKLQMTDIPGG